VAEDAHDLDDMVERACRLAFKDGFAKAGQRVIIVAGVPLGTPGATNTLRIPFVGAQEAVAGDQSSRSGAGRVRCDSHYGHLLRVRFALALAY
jgi:hypothetical protein